MTSRIVGALKIMELVRKIDKSHSELYFKLIKEFLRRQELWAQRLTLNVHLFQDLASAIDPIIRCSTDILSRGDKFAKSSAEVECCEIWLNWCWLVDNKPLEIQSYNLPDPFEPLERFFELNGEFTVHDGFIDIYLIGGVYARFADSIDLSKPIVDLVSWNSPGWH
jgi:hypothetical protein